MTTSKERMVKIFGFEVPAPGGSNEDKRNEIIAPSTIQICHFDEEELAGIDVTKRGLDFIEVDCGCTDQRYGDSVGKLRIYTDGKLEVTCSCYPGCKLVNVHPMLFEKHARTIGVGRWKSNVWVRVQGLKTSLQKTNLLKYFLGVHPKRNNARRGFVHQDEFMTCTKCGKVRRFERRNQHQCWVYHQAYLARNQWTCLHYPRNSCFCESRIPRISNTELMWIRMNCDMRDEREAKKNARKCPRNKNNGGSCLGCTKCVCFGCTMCRFEDCPCRTCVDYVMNAPGSSS
ncbi:protein ULTRAPETALA 2-like [Silene latifolia]|uniref:protein ULTRAPETALA 2-like n=1 Tax=Silene latifolia TaxID=37657 RepID=UPI003D786637